MKRPTLSVPTQTKIRKAAAQRKQKPQEQPQQRRRVILLRRKALAKWNLLLPSEKDPTEHLQSHQIRHFISEVED